MKKTITRNLSASPDSNAGSGLFHYVISVKFIDRANVTAQLSAFDAIKTLGTFSIQDQKNHVYILDFKSEFAKGAMEERLKELAGPGLLFDYTVEEVLRV
ncbi:MAG: hypothetical protein Q7R35_17075 [Elusimicrobiota bacterium]|nr:hypothetical protein [Elusimicrobiota bacterium]